MTEDQAHSQIAHSSMPFTEEVSETGPVTVISAQDFEVRWGHDAQLRLRARHAPDTAVAGGGLFELVDPARKKRWIIGCGLDRDPDDPMPFTDAHGVGLQFDRSFPLAVQPLVAECGLRLYENHSFVRLVTTDSPHGRRAGLHLARVPIYHWRMVGGRLFSTRRSRRRLERL